MRITKLHLLALFLIVGLIALGRYQWMQKKQQEKTAQERAQAELAERKREEEEALAKAVAEAASKQAAEAAISTQAASTLPVQYTVKKGDTLWTIAKDSAHFGKGSRWYDIWRENEDKILDFDHVPAGTELTIPLDKPEGYDWPPTSPERKAKILSRELRRKPVPTN